MSFDDLMNDTIDLLKTDGTKKTGLKASVQRTQIFMNANGILVEPEDLILRRMSNGAEETYRVIDPGFQEEFEDIEAHYQMQVQKLGLPEAKSAIQSITYNISGHNTRINQNSIDNSINTVQIDARAVQYVDDLRKEIERASLPTPEKTEALEIVDEIEAAFRSGLAKKSVVNAMLRSLPHVANIASIASALGGLLGGGA